MSGGAGGAGAAECGVLLVEAGVNSVESCCMGANAVFLLFAVGVPVNSTC